MKKFILLLFIFSFLLPILLGAADLNLGGLIDRTIGTLFYPLVQVIFALAFIAVLWNGVSLIIGSSTPLDGKDKGPTGRDKAKRRMLWGIVVLFVMFSIWGIIGILKNSFDLNETPLDTYPNFYPD